VRGEGADAQRPAGDRDPGKALDACDIDEQFRFGQPQVERGEQALAAGEHPRAIAVAIEQVEDLIQRAGFGVSEIRRFHDFDGITGWLSMAAILAQAGGRPRQRAAQPANYRKTESIENLPIAA
jgi:hypothetical protein